MPSEHSDKFTLDKRLQADCLQLGRFELCRVMLMNDSRYPWCILVPERPAVMEIFQLAGHDQRLLMQESSCLAEAMSDEFQADKMNIAVLGNIVPQLHVHHVVRYRDDFSWPGPVWGNGVPVVYAGQELATVLGRLQSRLETRCGLQPV
jgi:diadenosine tetraphosphate (Ap4A) HIT family hydrolase